MSEKRIDWEENMSEADIFEAYNKDGELLGTLQYERCGAYMHWWWHQEPEIRMSPGCLQEVRDKQKELWRIKNVRNKTIQ